MNFTKSTCEKIGVMNKSPILAKIWFSFFEVTLFLAAINLILGVRSELLTLSFLALHSLFTFAVLYSDRKYHLIFYWAFFIRIIFLIWDLYARDIFIFPNSSSDSEMFFQMAVDVSGDLSLLTKDIRGGIYSKLTGLLFYMVSPQRIIGQYLNVLLGISTVYVIHSILLRFDFNKRTTRFVLLIASFFPNSLVMSAVFLREMFITFFVAASLLYFIRWFQKNNSKDLFLSVAFICIASTFHCGVIGVLFGYFFAFVFYHHKSCRFKVSIRSGLMFIFLTGCLILPTTKYQSVFFGKFQRIDTFDDVFSLTNKRSGGAAYLNNLAIDTPSDLILTSPLRTLYFIVSPSPLDWRGIVDALTFLFDSSLYLGICLYILFNWKRVGKEKKLYFVILLALIGSMILFGVGVSNAGTAFRHRQKLIPFFLILMAITMDAKHRNEVTTFSRRRARFCFRSCRRPRIGISIDNCG